MKKINLSQFTLKIFSHLPHEEMRVTIPTLFTLVRIMLTPIIVYCMINNWWGYAFFSFVIACTTDVIDGLLARLLNEKTFLGACLDPVADKFLLIACFCTLVYVDVPLFLIPRWFVFFVISKEAIQLAGALIIYWVRGHIDVQPTLLGKITTCIQMIFIMWLFACYFFCWVPIKTYYTILGVTMFFIGTSFLQYVHIGLRMLKRVG